MKTLEILSAELVKAELTLTSLTVNADGTNKERPNASTTKKIKAVENKIRKIKDEINQLPLAEIEFSDAPSTKFDLNKTVNNDLLNQLSALNITDKLKKSSDSRSVFKKEYNNKSDRTKCRTKFLNAIGMYLLHTAHNKKDLAENELQIAKELAKKYYTAEDNFKLYSDYCTENLDSTKKSQIKLFIEYVNK